MGPAEAIRMGFERSLQFMGRSSRAEFWWFAPVAVFAAFVAFVPLSEILDELLPRSFRSVPFKLALLGVLLLPFIFASVRRIRDAGSMRLVVKVVVSVAVILLILAVFPILFAPLALFYWVLSSLIGEGFFLAILLLPIPLFLIYVLLLPSAPETLPLLDVSHPR